MCYSQPRIAYTTIGELILFYPKCGFSKDDLYDLGQHIYESHTDDNLNTVACYCCNETFDSKEGVMKYRKSADKEKVRLG